MNSFNSSPTTWDYTAGAANPAAERTLNNYGGGKHSLGLIGFTGAEYYFISNACVGFEVGLILQGSITTRGKSISEKMLGADRITIENETAPDSNFFHFGTNAGKKDLGGSTGKAGLALVSGTSTSCSTSRPRVRETVIRQTPLAYEREEFFLH